MDFIIKKLSDNGKTVYYEIEEQPSRNFPTFYCAYGHVASCSFPAVDVTKCDEIEKLIIYLRGSDTYKDYYKLVVPVDMEHIFIALLKEFSAQIGWKLIIKIEKLTLGRL